ncbi:hypothetical protein AAFF_G00094320 [Aldrovandia affinis]|uniref:Ig-like domain-containing protein n=1 Tax=Aldrovandia affinis TaxID=143900 RepID=A0AAD7T4R5_9TELE|nr:hypothetical protein AAFF_G00094320 [Aldrovandia affinis]
MEATQKDLWYFMVLAILLGVIKDAFLEKPADSIKKLDPRGMTLECVCPWGGNLSMIAWVKMPDKKPVAVYHPNHGIAIHDEYAGRVEFLRSSLMDGSISISNATAGDVGLYQCSVQTFPKGSWTKNILVEESVDLNLSTPVPMVVGKGDTFALRCNYVDDGSVYQVTFVKVVGRSVDTVALCSRVEGGFLGADYRERATVNCSDLLGASVQLTNVTEEDGGIYHCHFSGQAFGQATTVSLTVAGEDSVMSRHTHDIYMYIYIGGGVSGLVLIVVVTTSICWHKRKKRRAKFRAKLHPMQRRLLNNYEQAALYDRMNKRAVHQEDGEVYANIPRQPRQTTNRKT